MVSEIVHSVLSDNTNRRVTTIEETATKNCNNRYGQTAEKKAGTSRKTLLQPRPLHYPIR